MIITFQYPERSYGIVKTSMGKYSKPLFFTASGDKNLDEWKEKTLKIFTNKKFFNVERNVYKDYKNTFWIIKERKKFWKDFDEIKHYGNSLPGLNESKLYRHQYTNIYLIDVFYHNQFTKNMIEYFRDELKVDFLKFKEYPGNYERIIAVVEDSKEPKIPVINGKTVKEMKFEIM
jgi:hypothetical protein